MNYSVKMIRRPSANNGIRFCKYAVIVEKETNKIVWDGNYRYDIAKHLEYTKSLCERINKVGNFEEWFKATYPNAI